MTSPPSSSKLHVSPAKAPLGGSSGRSYDAKLVTREMHRLGTLAHSALAPSLVAASSNASSLALPATVPTSSKETGDTFWAQLHVHVLPLFNGEPLQVPIEDLNTLVRRHIESVVSRGPSRVLTTLENDAENLIHSGMITLHAKLAGIGDDEKLIARVVEIWGFFWDQVLPYVEGVLLPLQTEPLLLSLQRPSKGHRASSPTLQMADTPIQTSASTIDIRTLALRAFRDKIIHHNFKRLEASIQSKRLEESLGHQQFRLRQMLLVLLSQTHRPTPRTQLCLTAPVRPPSPAEIAIRDLLDASYPSVSPFFSFSTYRANGGVQSNGINALRPTDELDRPPSFLSGGTPRDRRGRVAGKNSKSSKPRPEPLLNLRPRGFSDFEDDEAHSEEEKGRVQNHGQQLHDKGGEQTPTNGFTSATGDMSTRRRAVFGFRLGRSRSEADRERDWDLLESLRSPDIAEVAARSQRPDDVSPRGEYPPQVPSNEYTFAGLKSGGLGQHHREADETSEWDKAQADVERMVGINTMTGTLATPTGAVSAMSQAQAATLAPIPISLRAK